MRASVEKANRLLDAGISKAILVTRTHFETEFVAYKEILTALSEVKNCIHSTRSVFIIAGEEDKVRNEADLVVRVNKLIRDSDEGNRDSGLMVISVPGSM